MYKDMRTDKIKLYSILDSVFVNNETKINLRFWKGDACRIVSGYPFEDQISVHDVRLVDSFVWQYGESGSVLYIDISND